MGNALPSTQKIVCGHTDVKHLRASLLCDRLSQPTADMVEALLALQDLTVKLEQLAEEGCREEPPPAPGGAGHRAFVLLATSYCILFGYGCGVPAEQGRTLSRGEPGQPSEFAAAFCEALRRPEGFLQDLLSLRAQAVPQGKLMSVAPLARDCDVNPSSFHGQHREVLGQLAVFLRGAVDCAEIYAEIRVSAASGRFDRAQAALLLDGEESDQRSMIGAMGGRLRPDEDDVEMNLCKE